LIFPAVKFVVAHDTGNPNSTAAGNVNYFKNSQNEIYASAHIFVDDKEIVECIPALVSDKPEKAWHVRYQVLKDNELYGYNANDAAIGIEYCYGQNINASEAYRRYVWVIAYTCYKFNLNPISSIVGHHLLDPGRKIDPVNGLNNDGRSYSQLLTDVVLEYNQCLENNNQTNIMMKLIRNPNSTKVYAIGKDNKKYWIFNGETFRVGIEMGLWGGPEQIEVRDDSGYIEGCAIILVDRK